MSDVCFDNSAFNRCVCMSVHECVHVCVFLFWEKNFPPLEEQEALLTAEPCLQPPEETEALKGKEETTAIPALGSMT